MAHECLPKMSLVAHYDDINRYTRVLTGGCEAEFKVFVESQKSLLKKINDLESELVKVKKINRKLDNEKSYYESRWKRTKTMLEEEIGKRRKLALEKESLEKQVLCIKNLLADGTEMDHHTKDKLVSQYKHQKDASAWFAAPEETVAFSPVLDMTDEELENNLSCCRKQRSRRNKSSVNSSQKNKRSIEKIQRRLTVDFEEKMNLRNTEDPHSSSSYVTCPGKLQKGNLLISEHPNSNPSDAPSPGKLQKGNFLISEQPDSNPSDVLSTRKLQKRNLLISEDPNSKSLEASTPRKLQKMNLLISEDLKSNPSDAPSQGKIQKMNLLIREDPNSNPLDASTPRKLQKINLPISEETNSNSSDVPSPQKIPRTDSGKIESYTYKLRVSLGSLPAGTEVECLKPIRRSSLTHTFVEKPVRCAENCFHCDDPIKFLSTALKCSSCYIICHPQCQEHCPMLCIPVTPTPKGTWGTLSDYTASVSPRIPFLIYYCVTEIESRGLKDPGLYRESGRNVEVKKLRDNLIRGKDLSALRKAGVHAICGTIKKFLLSLDDSLITKSARSTFVNAAESEEMSLNLVYNAVCELPPSNKETLAFLILHFKRVAKSSECKMPLENLAKVLAPTIVGYSTDAISCGNMWTETLQQCKVMQCLLQLPTEHWQNLLNVDICELYMSYEKTPERNPAPVPSRLGPIFCF